ncbi:hypothetical protein [Burkholderia sp. NLJ2]|uniref:hypothetical protein n=1 Tax=Burkholderia sp. NLJ2 TaxID=3090699 RepID=UPI003C6C20B5
MEHTTAGDSLDYDLTLEMNGLVEGISWGELFYNGSNGYRDLQGWIDHELELAEESTEEDSRPWNGQIDALPFGGFEYCDRIYVVTEHVACCNRSQSMSETTNLQR